MSTGYFPRLRALMRRIARCAKCACGIEHAEKACRDLRGDGARRDVLTHHALSPVENREGEPSILDREGVHGGEKHRFQRREGNTPVIVENIGWFHWDGSGWVKESDHG